MHILSQLFCLFKYKRILLTIKTKEWENDITHEIYL